MIQKQILLIMLLLISGTLAAQEEWEKLITEKPATAIEKADSLMRTGNNTDKIQGAIIKARAELLRDYSRYPEILKEFEGYIQKSGDPVEKMFLSLAAAEFYREYYNRNRWQINRRTTISSVLPENIDEWGNDLFVKKITELCLIATGSESQLKSSRCESYRVLLDTSYPYDLYPTLFEFACNQSIKLLTNLDNVRTDLSSFMLNTYRRWSAFERESKNTEALVAVDLNRLQYERTVAQRTNDRRADSLYLERLQEMQKEYADHPVVVQVLYAGAVFHLSNPGKDQAGYRKALELVRDGLWQFPKHDRIPELQKMQQDIEKPRVELHFPEVVYPGTLSFKTSWYHIGEVEIMLFRITEPAVDYYSKHNWKERTHQELVLRKKFSLPKVLATRDTTLTLPVTRGGLYVVLVAGEGLGTVSSFPKFVCSPFLTTNLQRKGYTDIVVRDAISGSPIKNAVVRLLTKAGYAETTPYKKHTEARTNEYGLVSMPDSVFSNRSRRFFCEAVSPEYPVGQLQELYGFRSDRRVATTHSVSLFTDRAIYRPGQTVYYKGIAWFVDEKKNGVEPDKKVTVQLYNANGEEIGTQSATTNRWGSFSGRFVIPKEIRNGQFYLRTENGSGSAHVRVEEYKLPGFEITTDTLKEGYRFNDTIRLRGTVKTYSGVPVQAGRVSYRITLRSGGWWWDPYSEPVGNGELYTDSDGNFVVDFLAKQGQGIVRAWGYYYDIMISASDTKGETQSISRQVNIGKEAYQVEIRMPEQIDKNKKEVVYIKTYNKDRIEIARTVPYKVVSLPPLKNLKESYDLDSLPAGKTILQGKIDTQTDSLLIDFSSWKSGAYLLTVENETTAGEDPVNRWTNRIFYLYAETDPHPPVKTYNWFVPLRTVVGKGEDAEVLFGTSAQETYVLYELFDSRSALIKREQLKLSDEIRKLSIPWKPEYGNEINLSLSFVKDNELFNNNTVLYKKQEDKRLSIRTKVFRDKLRPGAQESWEFAVTDALGKPLVAEIMAVLYDRSLDQLAPNRWWLSPADYLRGTTSAWQSVYPGAKNIDIDFPPYFRYRNPELRDYFRMYQEYAVEMEIYNIVEDRVVLTGFTGSAIAPVAKAESGEDAAFGEPANAPSRPVVPLRKNLTETALFYPDLYSNEQGELTLRFTVPETVTGWKLMLLGHTPDLKRGSLFREVTTSKELTVAPNVPRFFRAGDRAVLKTTVNNLSGTSLSGEAVLELFDPVTEKVISRTTAPFASGREENSTVAFDFTVPRDISVIGCRISAATASFSDGEQHLVAVVPDEVLLTQTLPLFSDTKGVTEYTLKPSAQKRKEYRLTVEVTSNPIWYAVMAIPSLQDPGNTENVIDLSAAFYANAVNYAIIRANPKIEKALQLWKNESPAEANPLEKDDELKSIVAELTPWAQQAERSAQKIPALQEFFNPNNLLQRQNVIADKLMQSQNADGSWSWFKGFPASPFMTCNTLISAVRAAVGGDGMITARIREMRIKGIRYLDQVAKGWYDAQQKEQTKTAFGYRELFYLYTRSFYRDLPLTDALEAHKAYMERLKQNWLRYSMYEKGLAATTLFRYGFQEEALRILNSLKEYATFSPEEGMFWANNTSSVSYINSAILTHVTILEAFYEITPKDPDVNRMKIWLLRQKQTQDWKDVPSTVNAIYALLLTGDDLLSRSEEVTVKLGNKEVAGKPNEPVTGYLKESCEAGEIRPDMLRMKLTKQTDVPTWGALYLQYFTPLKNIVAGDNRSIRVEKSLYTERVADGKSRLIPVQSPLSTGDKVIVRLKIRVDRDMEYVYLKDLRAACLEPVEQLSGMQWKEGLSYYRETKNSYTNFFFSYLPKGSYTIDYALWVDQSGTYQDGVAAIQCLYAPEFTSYSSSGTVQVR